MTDSQKLLAEYVENGSEAAFRELVTRYIGLVYATALRLASGDTHRAEDVTQTVFVALARRARALPNDVLLGGWLHRCTRFVAAKSLRTDRRRQLRERQAAEMNTLLNPSDAGLDRLWPILDEAIDRLPASDRAAILLRFFEQRDFRSVGEMLGSTEDTARKRVARALAKLHALLKRRGVVFPATALGAALAGEAVAAVPAGMAAGMAGTALATAAAGSGTVFSLLNIVTVTKLKTALVGAVVLAGVVTPLVIQHRAEKRLGAKEQALRQQSEQLAQLQSDNERLAGLLSAMGGSERPSSEMLRLRGEVAVLRQEVADLQNLEHLEQRVTAVRSNLIEQAAQQGILLTEEERRIGFPRELWKFSGYATPKAAIQSMMWAASEGNGSAFFDGYTVTTRAWNLRNRWPGRSENEIGAEIRAATENITRFSVYAQFFSPRDGSEITEVSIRLHALTEVANQRPVAINYSMIREGQDWKCCNQSSPKDAVAQP